MSNNQEDRREKEEVADPPSEQARQQRGGSPTGQQKQHMLDAFQQKQEDLREEQEEEHIEAEIEQQQYVEQQGIEEQHGEQEQSAGEADAGEERGHSLENDVFDEVLQKDDKNEQRIDQQQAMIDQSEPDLGNAEDLEQIGQVGEKTEQIAQNILGQQSILKEQPEPKKLVTDNYLNKLQNKIIQLTEQINTKKQQMTVMAAELQEKNRILKENKKQRLQTKATALKQDKENRKNLQIITQLTSTVQQHEQRLKEYQTIGDLNLLKERITQLETLCQAQRDQIALRSQNEQQRVVTGDEQTLKKSLQDYFRILQKNHSRLQFLERQNQQKQQLFNNSLEQTRQYKSYWEQAKQKEQQLRAKIQEMTEYSHQLQVRIQELERRPSLSSVSSESYEHKIAELEGRIKQYEREHFRLIPAQEIGIPHLKVMSYKEEKEAILKAYILLENENNRLVDQLQGTKTKYYTALRDNKSKEAVSVPKKDYCDVMSKYKKLRICLENSLRQIYGMQKARNDLGPRTENVYQLEKDQENPKEQLQRIVTEYTEKVASVAEKNMINKLTLDIVELKQQISTLNSQLHTSQSVNKELQDVLQVYSQQVTYKQKMLDAANTLLGNLQMKMSRANENRNWEIALEAKQKQYEKLQDMFKIYETKNILLCRENQSCCEQLAKWRNLYNSLKKQYEETLAAKSINSRQTVEQIRTLEEPVMLQETCSVCLARELEGRKQKEDRYTQSEGLTELQFKQIKELLNELKAINKMVQNVPKEFEKINKTVPEFKAKYETIFDKYSSKFVALKNEKAQNDQWRAKVREEVKEQFQEIRELIANNRMLNALRRAKSLIDYFEKQEQEKEEEQPEKPKEVQEQA